VKDAGRRFAVEDHLAFLMFSRLLYEHFRSVTSFAYISLLYRIFTFALQSIKVVVSSF